MLFTEDNINLLVRSLEADSQVTLRQLQKILVDVEVRASELTISRRLKGIGYTVKKVQIMLTTMNFLVGGFGNCVYF